MYTLHREDPIYPSGVIEACWHDPLTDCPQRGLTKYMASSFWTNRVRLTLLKLGIMLLSLIYVFNLLSMNFCKYSIAQY